jgi:hypothetical protein
MILGIVTMPFLMVNLDDPADCLRAWEQLGDRLERPAPGRRGRRCGPRGGCRPLATGRRQRGAEASRRELAGDPRDLPLMQKLRLIRPRRIWEYLHLVATQVHEPRSLPELDESLGLTRNKMRSVKAIMGKLERRWGLEFLVPAPDGSVDPAGNPRYVMPQPLRNKIVRLSQTPQV